MNYREYKIYQEDYLKKNTELFRADCMNPFKSMSYLIKDLVGDMFVDYGEIDIRDSFKDNILPNVLDSNIYYTGGVRDTLVQIETQVDKRVIIPKDIYPRYKQIFGVKVVDEYETASGINYDKLLLNKNKVILLAIPSVTDSEGMNISKIDFIKELSVENVVIVDMVYDNNFMDTMNKLKDLINNKNIILLYSLSKTYLLPNELGVVITSGNSYNYEYKKVKGENDNKVITMLEQYNGMGKVQEGEYKKGWARMSKYTGCNIEPGVGYFRVVKKTHTQLLKMGIFSIPISVFGGVNDDYSVITCIYYLDKV